jgi:hypothetical protein
MKERIRENAAEIARLHSRIHETYAERSKSPKKKREWELACAEFSERYSELAFPGGFGDALDRISSGNPEAMQTLDAGGVHVQSLISLNSDQRMMNTMRCIN